MTMRMEVLIVVILGQELGPSPAVFVRFLSRFKENGNQIVVRASAGCGRSSCHLSLRYLKQCERGTLRHFTS